MLFYIFSILCLSTFASAGIFSSKNVLVRSLKIAECSAPGHPGVVQFRDPDIATTAEGDLVLSGSFSTAVNLTSPLKVELDISRRAYGFNIPMPCIFKLGSCTFDDICQYGLPPDKPCPGALDENDVPCRCPITQGLYYLPGAQFPLPPTRLASLIAGRYKGTVKLSSRNRLMACYRILMELQ